MKKDKRPANAPAITNELLVTECTYTDVVIDYPLFNLLTCLGVAIIGMTNRFNIDPSGDVARITHGLIGLATERGELLDAYKKHWYYHKPLDMDNVREELGDMIWYLELLEDATVGNIVMVVKLTNVRELLGRTLEQLDIEYNDCRNAVIKKLRVRYPNNFTDFDADNRDTVKEMKAFVKETNKTGTKILADHVNRRKKGKKKTDVSEDA